MDSPRFAFGKNWKKYLKKGFNDVSLRKSEEYLKSFLQLDLRDKTFVDIGCGSGVHSLAAFKLGAQVTSIDVDQHSVECCEELAKKHHSPTWQVKQGSIVDDTFVSSLGCFDVVYCWGVAHHTGNMFKALANLANLVTPSGLLYVAIYNEVPGRRGSKMWQAIKRRYNFAGPVVKKIMEWIYISLMFLGIVVRLRNPFTEINNYYQKRGMHWTTDLIDWLGGYPYEYARAEVIFNFYRDRGFDLVNLKTTNYIGCNQFVFKKR